MSRSSAVDQIVTLTLPDELPDGTQVVSYRIISADGHPVAGSLLFSIGAATTAAALPASGNTVAVPDLDRADRRLSRAVRRHRRGFLRGLDRAGHSGGRIVIGALKIGLVSAVISLGLQGLDVLDLPLSAISAAATWRAGFDTSLGPSLLIAIVSMVIAWLRVAKRRP